MNTIVQYLEKNGEPEYAVIPAEKAGVGKSYISQIETGRREGSVSVYRAIAKALQVDIDDLVEP